MIYNYKVIFIRGVYMSADNKLSSGKKILSVFAGAFLAAFLWRARGTHGFGSSWGLFCVATCMTLLIFGFYGNRAKIKYELIPVGTLMMGLTVPGWGIVNQLLGGIIPVSVKNPIVGEIPDAAEINGFHGLFLMLMTGFALVCLYGIFVGTLFSVKEYKLWHYAVFVLVFFAVSYAAKLTFSHSLIRIIAPEIVDSFKNGLASSGLSQTVKECYISNILNTSAMKKIPFGRAYAESIEHISYCFSSLSLIVFTLIAFRDKITALVSFVINMFATVGITVSDVFNINKYDGNGSILKNVNLPSFLNITSWSLWELFTGFFIGFGIMLIIALLPDTYTSGKKYRSESLFSHKSVRFIYHFLFTAGFGLLAVPVRAFGLRLADTLEGFGVIPEKINDTVSYIIIAVCGIIAAVPVFLVLKKNILDKNLPVPVRSKPHIFSLKIMPVYILLIFVFYLLPDPELINYVKEIKNIPAATILPDNIALILSVCAFIMFMVIYLPVRKRLLSRH